MRKKIRQEQDDFVAKMKEQGIEVIDEAPTKNPFKRFGERLYYIFRDIRHFFHERKMRKLKLGTVCWKDNELKTINISWDIHWISCRHHPRLSALFYPKHGGCRQLCV